MRIRFRQLLPYFLLSIALVICWFGFDVSSVSATDIYGIGDVEQSGLNLSGDRSIIEIATGIIRVVLGLLGILVLGLILYAGFMWMTSAGNEERVATAKRILSNAVIGLVIILSAFAITQFVISRLSDAIQGDIPSTDPDPNYCDQASPDYDRDACDRGCENSFDTICLERNFFVKSISPSDDVSDTSLATGMNNTLFRVVFSQPVRSQDVSTAFRVRNMDTNQVLAINITETRNRRVLIGTYADGDTVPPGRYEITVRDDIRDSSGQALETTDVQNNRYPLTTQSHIDVVFDDTVDPEIVSFTINESIEPGPLFIGDVLSIRLITNDREAVNFGGISVVTFDIYNSRNQLLDSYVHAPNVRNTVTNEFGSAVPFDTVWMKTLRGTVFDSGDTYTIRATVHDIDSNQAMLERSFTLYAEHCNNGVLDGNETGPEPDTGGDCGTDEGGSCQIDSDCAPYMQCVLDDAGEGTCVTNPVILDFDKKDGAAGNWVTIFGRFFGDTVGTVSFGYRDGGGNRVWIPGDTISTAQCPQDVWHNDWIIVGVPGDDLPETDDIALRVTRSDHSDANPKQDDTLDSRGSREPFEKNTISRPGLCSVLGPLGYAEGLPESEVSVYGQSFEAGNTQLVWGVDRIGRVLLSANTVFMQGVVPQELIAGRVAVRARIVNGEESNGVPFRIIDPETESGSPVIDYIDPQASTVDSYLTIHGNGFGNAVGNVYIAASQQDVESCVTNNPSASCRQLDVTLPRDCGITWTNRQIIVRIQERNDEQLAEGEYFLLVEAIGGSTDGSDVIKIVDGPPQPSICAISPSSGIAPLTDGNVLALVGENFGTTGTVHFWTTGGAIGEATVSGWMSATIGGDITTYTDTEVRTAIPVDSTTDLSIPADSEVPIRIQSNQGILSNSVVYTTADCTTLDTIPEGYQCCTTGPDTGRILSLSGPMCAGQTRSSGYTWRFSTGIFPEIPQVVEQCQTQDPTDIPSPAPSTLWSTGENSCINALVVVQFTHEMLPSTISNETVALYACSGEGRGCDRDRNLFGTGVDSVLSGDGKTLHIYNGQDTNLAADTWYRVELSEDIQSNHSTTEAGRTIVTNEPLRKTEPCGNDTAYCFDFKTSATGALCTITDALVSPSRMTVDELGPVRTTRGLLQPFTAYGVADQECIILDESDLVWDWSAFTTIQTPDPVRGRSLGAREVRLLTLSKVSPPSHIRTVETVTPIEDQPIRLVASTTVSRTQTTVGPDGVEEVTLETRSIDGESQLFVALGDPQVEQFWPNCTQACDRTLVGARFNRGVFVEDIGRTTIRLEKCTDESCTFRTGLMVYSVVARDMYGFDIAGMESFTPNSWYQVTILDGIRSIGGYTNTNQRIAGDTVQPFAWKFKTKAVFDGCAIDSVEIVPQQYLATRIGEKNMYTAFPYGAPDECSPYGQRLNPLDYGWSWSVPVTADPDVVHITNFERNRAVQDGQCTGNCLPAGSDVSRTALAQQSFLCGNGVVDFGEECDIDMDGEIAGSGNGSYTCTYSCLRPGNAVSGSGSLACGNGVVDNPLSGATAGEACDDGNTTDGDGCSSRCLLEGSAPSFDGSAVGSSYCSPDSDGITIGESCEIDSNGNGLYLADTGSLDSVRVVDADELTNSRQYCSARCQALGTPIAQSYCDAHTLSSDICAGAVSVCGNSELETGEQCEILADTEQITPSGAILVDIVLADGTTLSVFRNDATRVCSNSCVLENICSYENNMIASGSTLFCLSDEEGCTSGCTFAGASLEYSVASVCHDGIVGIGEAPQCEVARTGPSQGAGPSQIATAIGESSIIDPITFTQETQISARATSYLGDDTTRSLLEEGALLSTATYYLQCGYTEFDTPDLDSEGYIYNTCPDGQNGYSQGVGANTCCYPRTRMVSIAPTPEPGSSFATNICRNTVLQATFDSIIDDTSLVNNVFLAKRIDTTAEITRCEDVGLEDVSDLVQQTLAFADTHTEALPTNVFARIWQTVRTWIGGLIDRVYAAGDGVIPVGDGLWCKSRIPFRTVVQQMGEGDTATSVITVTPRALLDADSDYTLMFRGGKNGVRDNRGVPIQPNNPASISEGFLFETGSDICKVASISVEPASYLFSTPFEAHDFTIRVQSTNGQSIAPIPNVYDWEYDWEPQGHPVFAIPVDDQPIDATSDTITISARDIEGEVEAQASIVITADQDTTNTQVGRRVSTRVPFAAIFCANIWPSRAADGSWSKYFNDEYRYAFWYCADAGNVTTQVDDLPVFAAPQALDVPAASALLGTSGDIRDREIFFSPTTDDAFGIQVYANTERLSAYDWYARRYQDVSEYDSIQIDGYDGITNGRTYYVNALNVVYEGDGTEVFPIQGMYNNIYQFTVNEGAQRDTLDVFSQIIDTLQFNTNISDDGYCLEAPFTRRGGAFESDDAYSCVTDFDCRTSTGEPIEELSGECSNNRTALRRDLERLDDLKRIQAQLEQYRANNSGQYPLLDAGTYYPGYTVSRWPSWGRLNQVLGGIPIDPINQWADCGTIGTDQQTCWNADETQYYCPLFSQVYEYAVNDSGFDYTLYAPFEYLRSTDSIVTEQLTIDRLSINTPWCTPGSSQSPTSGSCGNGIVERADGESCDPPGTDIISTCMIGGDPTAGRQRQTCSDTCELSAPSVCLPQFTCGNGIVEDGEACDYGELNGEYGSGCSAPSDTSPGCQLLDTGFCGNERLDYNDVNGSGTLNAGDTQYERCDTVTSGDINARDAYCAQTDNGGARVWPEVGVLISVDSFSVANDSLLSEVLAQLSVVTGETVRVGKYGIANSETDSTLVDWPTNLAQFDYEVMLNDLGPTNGTAAKYSVVYTDLVEGIQEMVLQPETTSDWIFTADNRDAPKILFIITTGNERNPDESAEKIAELKAMGINVVIVKASQRGVNNGDVLNEYAQAAVQTASARPRVIDSSDWQHIVQDAYLPCMPYALAQSQSCTLSCQAVGGYCGDGVVNGAETCDDGNFTIGDGCSPLCVIEEAELPVGSAGTANSGVCGDGLVQAPNGDGLDEVCDLGDANGTPCDPSYNQSCTYCAGDCRAILTVDPINYCGDGIVNVDEDGTPLEVCDIAADGDIIGTVCSRNQDVWCTNTGICPGDANDTCVPKINMICSGTPRVDNNNGEPCVATYECTGTGSVCQVAPPKCEQLGEYTCAPNCQALTGECTTCRTFTRTGDPDEYGLHPSVRLVLFNPMGVPETINGTPNYFNTLRAYFGGYFGVGGAIPSEPIDIPSSRTDRPLRSANTTFADIHIESNAQCMAEYTIQFGDAAGVTTQSDTFELTLQGQRAEVVQPIVVSPPVLNNMIRVVVRAEGFTGVRDPVFALGVYGQDFNEGAPYIGGSVAENLICREYQSMSSGVLSGFLLPASNTGSTSTCRAVDRLQQFESIIDRSVGVSIQSMDVDLAGLQDQGRVGIYVAIVDKKPIQPHQNSRVFVDVYTARDGQTPTSIYKPSYTFDISQSVLSSNPLAPYWHVFNLVKMEDNTRRIELLDAVDPRDRTTLRLNNIPSQSVVEQHGQIRTLWCELIGDVDRNPLPCG